ncbi:putative DD34D transposase [Trichonephila clavipes]|nr:putative DD34D transposase [Trichonephila clavipes]
MIKVQLCIIRFRSGIFDVKDAPHTGWPVVKNIDKITEIIEVDGHFSSPSIVQELNINHKTVLNYLSEVGFKKKLDCLPYGQTLNSDLYCEQLNRLKLAIAQKRPELANRRGVGLHQDNARTYMSVVTCQKFWELDWEVLMHPPYSPDLAPSVLPPFSCIAKPPE